MKYSLLPFPTHAGSEYEGLPDLRAELESRSSKVAPNAIANLDLLNQVVDLLEGQPWKIWVNHCRESVGQLHLAVYGGDMGRQVDLNDEINAGFFLTNCERGNSDLQASTRIYRVACENGAIVEVRRGSHLPSAQAIHRLRIGGSSSSGSLSVLSLAMASTLTLLDSRMPCQRWW